jgi:hypothetical protein
VVNWVEVEHEVRPRHAVWRVQRTVNLTLHGGSAITESSSAMNPRGQTVERSAQGRFRDELRSQSSWRVLSTRTLSRAREFRQHVETVQVTIGPNRACRANVSYRLKSGFREYTLPSISTGVPLYFSSLRAENIDCQAR